jgi:hypothetical protein
MKAATTGSTSAGVIGRMRGKAMTPSYRAAERRCYRGFVEHAQGEAMSDADDRFVESLAAELTPLVGPRLRVSAIDLERPADDQVKITVTLDSSAEKPTLMVEEGDSLTIVVARLIARAPEVRLADGFREIVEGISV